MTPQDGMGDPAMVKGQSINSSQQGRKTTATRVFPRWVRDR